MNTKSEESVQDWVAASKQSLFRWPALTSLAGTVVFGLNVLFGRSDTDLNIGPVGLRMTDAFWIFACILIATFPVWYYSTSHYSRHRASPPRARQIAACLGLVLAALLLTPSFGLRYRDYNTWSDTYRRDNTTTWIKRSAAETWRMPGLKLDQLAWLQSNYSVDYIPAQVYCPRRSARLFPFFGVVNDMYDANALAPGIGENGKPPPAAALANTIARCNREGPAMRSGGYTKEGALAKGDVDGFFALNALETEADTGIGSMSSSVVLEDAEIPAPILAKLEAVLADQPDSVLENLDDPNYKDFGQARRFTSLAIARATGRAADAARLKAANQER
jgi:hypothetical protein